jgi:hypothetical protein
MLKYIEQNDYILVKLLTGAVVFGQLTYSDENHLSISKPFEYLLTDKGTTLSPYDMGSVQGEIQNVNIRQDKIIYAINFKDCPEALKAYQQATSAIIMSTPKIII